MTSTRSSPQLTQTTDNFILIDKIKSINGDKSTEEKLLEENDSFSAGIIQSTKDTVSDEEKDEHINNNELETKLNSENNVLNAINIKKNKPIKSDSKCIQCNTAENDKDTIPNNHNNTLPELAINLPTSKTDDEKIINSIKMQSTHLRSISQTLQKCMLKVESNNRNYESKIDTLQNTNEKLQSSNDRLRQQIGPNKHLLENNTLRQQYKELESKMNDSEIQRKQSDNANTVLNKEVTKLRDKISQFQSNENNILNQLSSNKQQSEQISLLKNKNNDLEKRIGSYKTIIILLIILSVIFSVIGGYGYILYENKATLLSNTMVQITMLENDYAEKYETHSDTISALRNKIQDKTSEYNNININYKDLNAQCKELNTSYQSLQNKYEKELGECNVDKFHYQTEKKQSDVLSQKRMSDLQKEKEKYTKCTELLQKCKSHQLN